MIFPDINIVLYSPQIPPNTGNIARLTKAVGGRLVLIGPLGFSLDEKKLKRAGLDYWEDLRLTYYKSWDDFHNLELKNVSHNSIFLITSKGNKSIYDIKCRNEQVYLIFGNETMGLPISLHNEYKECRYRIPMVEGVRCLNLSTAVGIAVYVYIGVCGKYFDRR